MDVDSAPQNAASRSEIIKVETMRVWRVLEEIEFATVAGHNYPHCCATYLLIASRTFDPCWLVSF